jgi:dihydrolipoamide dehydrogenase
VLPDNIEKTNKDIGIMGAGPTGVELAFKLKNLGYNPQLIEGANEILPGFSKETIQEVNEKLVKSNINLIKSNPVISVEPNLIKTRYLQIPFDIAIWTGGVKFNGYLKTHLYRTLNSIGKVTPRGIEVKDDFSIEKYPNVFCIGDIVSNAGPPTAQNASNQAKWLAQYFSNSFDKNKMDPYKINEIGKILHIDGKIYLESKYYTGYIPKIFESIIDYVYKR